jgi:hypothetical protein
LKTLDDYRFEQYRLDEIEAFLASLSAEDELEVEATGNSRWLVNLVEQRARTSGCGQSGRIRDRMKRSVKKTDKRDALNLARFLAVDMLPQVRIKSELAEAVSRLNETRNKLVGLKTSLINKIHALAVSRGWKLKKESLSSKKGLSKVMESEWTQLNASSWKSSSSRLARSKQASSNWTRRLPNRARGLKDLKIC